MMQGWFIDPSGRRSLLIAGNKREFSVLVHRKLRAGWKLAPDSPHVPEPGPWDEDVVVGIGPPAATPPSPFLSLRTERLEFESRIPLPPPPVAVEPPSPSLEERAAAVAEAFNPDSSE